MPGRRPSAKGWVGAPFRMELTMPGGLTARVLGACVLVTLVVSLVFVLLLQSLAAERRAVDLSTHSRNVMSSADEAERLVIDLETGVRGFLLTGEESFLEPWTAARQVIGPETANLQRLARVPAQHERSLEITEAIDSYVDDYSVPLVEAARRGDPRADSVATTADGKQRVDEIRRLFQDLRTAERQLLSDRDANSLARTRQTVIAASAGLGISVAVMLLLAAYWTRSIVRPVLRTARMANRLADGDLAARVPETGVGEMRTLERSFNQMASSISELLQEQSALRQVATLVARGEPPDAVFAAVVEQAAAVLDVDAVTLVRQEPDGTVMVLATWGLIEALTPAGERLSIRGSDATSRALQTGTIARQENVDGPQGSMSRAAHDLGVRLAVAAPIVVEGVVWGAMVVATTRPRQPGEIDARLAQFTELVATTISNSQAREDLAASRARLVAASDETRRRIERDLHDGIQQRLVTLALDLRLVEDGVADQPWLTGKLAEVAGELDATITELRELCRGIHPAILTQGGLGSALKALARRSPVPVDVELRIGSRPSLTVEAAAYYVAAEALTNATKHAQASGVRIEAANHDGLLELLIVDDGVGGADPRAGSGLTGLMDRVDALGGRMNISSPPGQGTRMRVELPLTNG
jgi:signal transduction histidine kinase